MHGHGSTRVEIVHPSVFWDETKAVRANTSCLGSEYRDGVRGTDIVEYLVGVRVVAERSDHQASMFLHAE